MRNRYQRGAGRSKGKFEAVAGRELAVHLWLPLVEVWEEFQAEVERLTGGGGRDCLRAVHAAGRPAGPAGSRRDCWRQNEIRTVIFWFLWFFLGIQIIFSSFLLSMLGISRGTVVHKIC